MVMNGFDTNFDGANEVYAVNTVAFHHQRHPVELKLGELVRIYVVNVLEFDSREQLPHARQLLRLLPDRDQARALRVHGHQDVRPGGARIMEFSYDFPGRFMFHAHVSEFAELGWMGLFDVKE